MTEFELLLNLVCEHFGVTTKDIKSKKQSKRLKLARSILINIAKHTFMKDERDKDLAKLVGRKRTSVIYHRNKHEIHYKFYKDYKVAFNDIKKNFSSLLDEQTNERKNKELVSE